MMSIIPKQGEMMIRIAQIGLKNLRLNKIQNEMKTRKSNKVKINQKMKVMMRRCRLLKKSNKIMNMMTNSNL